MGSWGYQTATDTIGFPNQQEYRYRSTDAEEAAGQFFLNPSSVRIYDYATFQKNGESYDSWFINDKININRNLTVSLGLRWDRYSSWLPEQGNNGSGPFATKSLFPARGPDEFPIYNSFVPRLSMVYDITGEGRVALKASYGRYAGSDSGTGILPGSSAGSINPAGRTRWQYEWDGTIPFVPDVGVDGIFGTGDDRGLESVDGGGGQITETLANGLKAPFTDEWTLGIDLGLSRDYGFRFTFVQKIDKQHQKRINTALPFEAFTDSVSATDPGPDNITGTADDNTISIWSVPRSHPNFGTDFEHTIQSNGKEGQDVYSGFELTFNKSFTDRWSFMFSYTNSYRKLQSERPALRQLAAVRRVERRGQDERHLRVAVWSPVFDIVAGSERKLLQP